MAGDGQLGGKWVLAHTGRAERRLRSHSSQGRTDGRIPVAVAVVCDGWLCVMDCETARWPTL